MNFFALLVVVIATISMSSGAELRKIGKAKFLARNNAKAGLQTVTTFPTNPTYGISEMYQDAACTSPMMGQLYLLDTCMVGTTYSSMYTCSSGTIVQTDYTDLACTTGAAANTLSTSTCTGQTMTVSCSSSTAFPGNAAQQSYYQLSGCKNLLAAQGMQQGYCMDTTAAGVPSSQKVSWPYFYVYATADCTGSAIKEKITSTCYGPNTDDDAPYDYATYMKSTGSGAFSNLSFGFGALVSAVMVALQLMKN